MNAADAEHPRPSDAEAVRFVIRLCIEHGIDPLPIIADELRAMGYTVTPPPTAADAEHPPLFPGPLYRLCDDPNCRQLRHADPPRVHYHWTGADAEQPDGYPGGGAT